ncbi:uncharacterized protein LOC129303331 [Prosopis cineraria]|uniref:uncharacterized protein LOC129303331 n=1 Tax=Prosopis cineraria TaxID=364024 RepID=UPI00240FF9BD|nr:uncharacterized protein LOC129303331 [Prosopis cineraria]XP_054798560.1 uncharacterized protein LOC129303331 [Prosopis cineraria]
MVSVDTSDPKDEIEETYDTEARDSAEIETSASPKTSGENPARKFQNTLSSNLPSGIKFHKFGSVLVKSITERNQFSQSVTSSGTYSFRKRFSGMFTQKLDWVSLKNLFKEWIRNPMNMALFAWIICVAVSGAILFLVMTGMLNSVLPKKSQRNTWFEINNQILNALFTLMCLYQHPKRFHHLVLLSRWRQNDMFTLRKVYCKNGTYKPHERAHMMVVVLLLHVNCFAQYALCSLNLGYKRSERPVIGVGICISLAIAAPAIAGLYAILSPLGRDYDFEMDEEKQLQTTSCQKPLEKKYSFATRDGHDRVFENEPQWRGGILDIWEDISTAYLSLFCTFCVFGRNMERLGFGNMYVHIATFILFCTAPFWIFILAAVDIDNDNVREALVATGIILCFLGLLYGGFWRIQMRKRFNLPAYTFCFGEPSVSDCTFWLCCCWCALAQEARTGNSYDVVEDKFCRRQVDIGDQLSISSLPCEDGILVPSDTSSSLGNNSCPSKTITSGSLHSDTPLSTVHDNSFERGQYGATNLPVPAFIRRDGP